MKKNFKTLVLGMVIGATLVGTPVLADVIWEKISVVRNYVTVMIDGEKLNADNFLYLDTTYVPIRAVSEALGKNVSYKDGVAYIGDTYGAVFGGADVDLGNGYTATADELEAYTNRAAKDIENTGAAAEQIEASAKEDLLQYKALSAIAAENNIKVGEDFENNFANIIAYMKMNYGGEEGMLAAMEEAGFTYELYKRYQETDYLYRKLLSADAFRASDAEISSYYEANKSSFPYDGIQAQHVLIGITDETGNVITDEAKLKELEKKAQDVYNQAKKGTDFSSLVEKYGEDPGMNQNPDGYIFTKGEMIEEFETAAFALKDGEISQPVKTAYGWHIIKRIKAHTIQPLDSSVASTIAQTLAAEKIQIAIDAKLGK